MTAVAGVVIPAHDEERVIARTLERLYQGVDPDQLEVVVVCNGCTDQTADVARSAAPHARVLEITEASKVEAVRVGSLAGTVFPRVHLDADVSISGLDVLDLVRPIQEGRLLATAPRRVLDRDRSALGVRWFYDVWERLPQVRDGLFGRGVIALSREGQHRVDAMPRLLSDDLGMSEAFAPGECAVIETASVVVHPPRTLPDLLRRRVRVATGNAQASRLGVRRAASVTTLRSLAALVREHPRLAPRLPVFLAVGVVARMQSQRAVRTGDFTTWLRDESSRG